MSADKRTPFNGPKPGSDEAKALGCVCPRLEDLPDDERAGLPGERGSTHVALLAPHCELHGGFYNRLREIAERGIGQVIMSSRGEVVHEGGEDKFDVPSEKLVDGVIDALKHTGLRPTLLTASACLSVGTSLCVAHEMDREVFMEVCGKIWESSVEERARIIAARTSRASGAN